MKVLIHVEQKISVLINQYRVLSPEKNVVAFVSQKRFALREKFEIYADESKKRVIGYAQARQVMDFGATYDVFDEHMKPLGALRKGFKKSLLMSTWHLYSDQELKHEVATIKEKSKIVAIARRIWQFIPDIDLIPFFIKFHFVIRQNNTIVGEYNKTTLFRDNYELVLNESITKKVDLRTWVVMAVLLDALQDR